MSDTTSRRRTTSFSLDSSSSGHTTLSVPSPGKAADGAGSGGAGGAGAPRTRTRSALSAVFTAPVLRETAARNRAATQAAGSPGDGTGEKKKRRGSLALVSNLGLSGRFAPPPSINETNDDSDSDDSDPLGSSKRGSASFIDDPHVINRYLCIHIRHSFDELVSILKDSTGTGVEKQKSLGKVLATMREMTLVKVDVSLMTTLIRLFSVEDRKVVRLLHHFLCEMALDDTLSSTSAIPVAIPVRAALEKELKSDSAARRQAALRSLARVTDAKHYAQHCVPVAREYLSAKGISKRSSGRSRKISLFGGRAHVPERDRMATGFGVLRFRWDAFDHIQFLDDVIAAVKSCKDAIGLRHGFSLLRSYTIEHTQDTLSRNSLAELLREHKKIPVEDDPSSAVELLRLCKEIIKTGESSPAVPFAVSTTMYFLASAKQVRVFIAAVHAASVLPWRTLAAKPEMKPAVQRLANLLVQPLKPVLFAVCGAAVALAQSCVRGDLASEGIIDPSSIEEARRVSWAAVGTSGGQESILQVLVSPIRSVLKSTSPFVRAQALKALSWLGESQDIEHLQNAIVSEIIADKLPQSVISELLQSLLDRVRATPSLAPALLSVCWRFCAWSPDKLDTDLLITCLHECADLRNIVGPQLVLERVLRVLDLPFSEAKRQPMLKTHKALYWFVADLVRDDSVEDDAVREIILRLQQGAVFNTWDTRIVCLQALSKIALASSGSMLDQLTSFLREVSDTSAFYIRCIVEPVVGILAECARERERLAEAITRASAEDVEEIRRVHTRLVKKMCVYGGKPSDYSPLGPEVQPLLGTDVKIALEDFFTVKSTKADEGEGAASTGESASAISAAPPPQVAAALAGLSQRRSERRRGLSSIAEDKTETDSTSGGKEKDSAPSGPVQAQAEAAAADGTSQPAEAAGGAAAFDADFSAAPAGNGGESAPVFEADFSSSVNRAPTTQADDASSSNGGEVDFFAQLGLGGGTGAGGSSAGSAAPTTGSADDNLKDLLSLID